MIEIYLIITKGCKACSIAENIISKATDQDINVIDCKEVPNWISSNVKLEDFPITIITKNKVIKEVLYGTFTIHKFNKVLNNLVI